MKEHSKRQGERRPLTDAALKVPHRKKSCWHGRNVEIDIWSGMYAKQFADPQGKANITASTRDPCADGQQKTPDGTGLPI